jgi:hypothetical protein
MELNAFLFNAKKLRQEKQNFHLSRQKTSFKCLKFISVFDAKNERRLLLRRFLIRDIGKRSNCVTGLPDGLNQNPHLGIFCRDLDWKLSIYLTSIWDILRTFGVLNVHLVHFVFIWYIFLGFGIMYQEKSGNPGKHTFPTGFHASSFY